MVTLFTLMVVNNWMVQVQMYVDIMGGNTYYRWYFCLFYYFSVIIGINIVVAFAIDMYSSVERLDQDRMDTLKILEEELTRHNDEDEADTDMFNIQYQNVDTMNNVKQTKEVSAEKKLSDNI